MPSDDYAGSIATTGTLTVGGSVTGRLEIQGDTDWFAISLTAGQSYIFNLDPASSSGLSDPYLYLYDRNGTLVTWDDDSGPGLASQLIYTPTATATHYLAAAAYADYWTGSYLLSATTAGTSGTPTTTGDDYPANNTTTGSLTPGATIEGNLESAGDSDWFAISLVAGVSYTFNLDPASSGGLSDPYLYLYGSNGILLAQDDDSGPGLASELTYTPTSSGTYYLDASSYGGYSTGRYTLSAAWPVPGGASLTGGQGSAEIVGTNGLDQVTFRESTDYCAITRLGGGIGQWRVEYLADGEHATDTLTGVERLSFLDHNLALDLFSTRESGFAALALFHAGFHTLPDPESFGYWLGIADGYNALTPTTSGNFRLTRELAQAMLDHYAPGGIAHADLVELLYTNVVGTPPSEEERDGYVAWLDSGFHTQASLAAYAAESYANYSQYADLVSGGMAYASPEADPPPHVDALIWEEGSWPLRWNGDEPVGSPATVTYSFMTRGPSYADATETSTFSPFTTTQQAAAREILGLYAEIANLTFTEVSDSGDGGQIRFGLCNQSGSSAYSYPPGDFPSGGDVWLNRLTDYYYDATGLSHGQYGFSTLAHEIGHALGLKHPGNYDSSDEPPFLPTVQDSEQYTLMSYNHHPRSLYYDSATRETYAWNAESPMLFDVAAIQYLYGANANGNRGDTTYTFDPATPLIHTIWDGSGNDTIDLSNFSTACRVDLIGGHFSSIGTFDQSYAASLSWPAGTLSGNQFYDGSDNLAIAFDCVIENATGGSADDLFIGNQANNRLDGRGGSDRVLYNGYQSEYTVSGSNGLHTVARVDGTDLDTLVNMELLVFRDGQLLL